MDPRHPRQSNVGEDSQEQSSGGNMGAYQHGWNPYIAMMGAVLQIQQDTLKFKREQHEQKMRKEEKEEDERILKIDLDACPPNLRLYYQTCQEDILEKQAARRRSRQGP